MGNFGKFYFSKMKTTKNETPNIFKMQIQNYHKSFFSTFQKSLHTKSSLGFSISQMFTMKTKLCFYYKLTSMIYIKKLPKNMKSAEKFCSLSLSKLNSCGCVEDDEGCLGLRGVALKH
jgi:hypothetical protein